MTPEGGCRGYGCQMLLSRTGRYALMATLEIARAGVGGSASTGARVPAARIADALGVPANYLSKILHQLARAGVLVSERGPSGGFRLAEAADRLSLETVLAPVEPGLGERDCLLGRSQCLDEDPCAAHERWRGVNEAFMRFLRDTTLADLLSNSSAG